MTGIPNYDVERPRDYGSLHADPQPDGFTHESPIRTFTDWTVNGRYAIGKGFRPSLQHLTVYLDAMERLEGWALRQILEAASGSPSFVFRKVTDDRLAAAAPSMLAALRKVYLDWDGEPEDMIPVREAIKEATGK